MDPAKEQNVKDIREGAKKELEKLEGNLFPCGEEEIVRLQEETARYMDVLVSLTDRFEDAFWQMKQERGIADFSDVAHGALRVLIRTDENGYPVTDDRGGYVPTEQAREYADYFEEIYIDEYQDSNSVQEILLWSISRDAGTGHNRFLVGDVKQSIYRFRMAEPELFVEKAAAWSPDEEAAERRIDLHRNFRSREEVLSFVNACFTKLMAPDLGGVDSLYSIVQMPSGIPCATVAINGGKNAGILAAKILAVSDPELLSKLEAFTENMKNEVAAKDAKLQEIGYEAYLQK